MICNEYGPADKDAVFASLPPLWPDAGLREAIAQENQRQNRCVVAVDDDPTGTQTVHGVEILNSWQAADLVAALSRARSALYILTNSRSMPAEEAAAVAREVGTNLMEAARITGRSVSLVSRSDSTLRGHFPTEVDVLANCLDEAGRHNVDGILLVPYFREAGRFTIQGIHWVQEGSRLVPAASTVYARDPAFSYTHSALAGWVEEKTGGCIPAANVQAIPLKLLRAEGPQAVSEFLCGVSNRAVVVVDAADDRDLEVLAAGVQAAERQGKRFLFRSAASMVKVLAGISDRLLLNVEEIVGDRPPAAGLVVVGSYVPNSTSQLDACLSLPGIAAIELDVDRGMREGSFERQVLQAAQQMNKSLQGGQDVVLYTSRRLFESRNGAAALDVGQKVTSALVDAVRRVAVEPRFLIAKGGITSNELAARALRVRSAWVLGQVSPGVSVWRLPEDSQWPGLPYIVFPGNVGDINALRSVFQMLRAV